MLTMKVLLPLMMIATLVTSTAYAECTVPNPKINIPNGSKATKDEIVATKQLVTAYNNDVTTFGACLKTEEDAAIAAAGDKLSDDERLKIAKRYADRNDSEVDKLKKVVDKFNIELRAFKAKNPA
jgi:hypothetical protein